MASVNTEATVTLKPDEKELLEKAIKIMEEIAEDTDLFVDADSIFASINDAYRHNDKKLPTVIQIWE